jgi:hypothetical protein
MKRREFIAGLGGVAGTVPPGSQGKRLCRMSKCNHRISLGGGRWSVSIPIKAPTFVKAYISAGIGTPSVTAWSSLTA